MLCSRCAYSLNFHNQIGKSDLNKYLKKLISLRFMHLNNQGRYHKCVWLINEDRITFMGKMFIVVVRLSDLFVHFDINYWKIFWRLWAKFLVKPKIKLWTKDKWQSQWFFQNKTKTAFIKLLIDMTICVLCWSFSNCICQNNNIAIISMQIIITDQII